jgi:hypothetical protein
VSVFDAVGRAVGLLSHWYCVVCGAATWIDFDS